MSRYLQALDPRRSLATAVAWFAVVLSLSVALALLAVGDFAVSSMLAQRDAEMMRFAAAATQALERAIVGEGGALPQHGLEAVFEAARARAKPDPRATVLLLDERHGVRYAWPQDVRTVPEALPGVSLQMTPTGAMPSVTQPWERPEGGRRVVVVTAPLDGAPHLRALGLHVTVVQPSEERGHGGTIQEKLTAISILLSIVAALIGAAFARGLTRRLSALTEQVQQVAEQGAEGIHAPRGHDEVAVLGREFARLLHALRDERDGLNRLTQELEQRVRARTREVERLAAESRYAAVVRERLRLARDLHDTLAHSMMEMLLEVRTLRMLHAHDPQRLAAELERAEEVARQGLKEARDAVSEMRLNTVRDLGLGAALSGAIARFSERTGLRVRYRADPQAASFADPRAEGVFRIAEEALRNIDRHAHASSVELRLEEVGEDTIELTIADDGVGFDPAAEHPGHFGLTGIREQAQLIDAQLALQSQPRVGTTLRLRLRVGPEMHAGDDESHDPHAEGNRPSAVA